MPLNQAASAAASSGSVLYDSATEDDSDRFTTRMMSSPVVDRELEAVDDVEHGRVAAVVGRP